MLKKISLILLTAFWIYLINVLPQNIPFVGEGLEKLPQMGKVFNYCTSPLHINNKFENSLSFPKKEFGKVQIGYDSLGIPHIFAENKFASAYGIGYAQARDRLFQIEMIGRTVRGELSEVVGKRALNLDKFWRKFRFTAQAKAWSEKQKNEHPEEYKYFEAYAQGINDYINRLNFNDLPIEFYLLDFRPSEFKVENLFYLVRYMDKVLNYNENDILFSQLKGNLSDDLIDFYYPFINPNAFPIYPNFKKDSIQLSNENFNLLKNTFKQQSRTISPPFGEMSEGQRKISPLWGDARRAEGICESKTLLDSIKKNQIARNYKIKDPIDFKLQESKTSIGSNNWAVSGKKSVSGFPMLCNDTHLTLQLPSTWYEMHISINGKITHGMAVAGAPYIISGFNEKVAWGITNATWDLVDFYKIDLKEDLTYELDGEKHQLEKFTETFKIKGKKPIQVDFYQSYFGPMDSIADDFLAVNWVAMQNSNEALAFTSLSQAQDVNEAFEALQNFQQPPQNFVLADVKGNIALATCGLAAIHHSPSRGIILANSKNNLVRYESMHKILNEFNPERNFVHSANQNHTNTYFSAFLSNRYAPNSRGRRISQLLSSKEKFGFDDLRNVQMDVVDLEWEILKEKMLEFLPQNETTELQNWDGTCDTNSIAATQFYNFKRHLAKDLNYAINPEIRFAPQPEHLLYLIKNNDSLPTKNGKIASVALIQKAWKNSQKHLETQFGTDKSKWIYGKYHQVLIQHSAKIPQLSMIPFAAPGSNRTINVATGFPAIHGPSKRTIIELNPNGIRAKMVIAGGQSGRFNSQNYTNQVQSWRAGKYHTIELKRNFKTEDFVNSICFDLEVSE